MLHLRVLLLGDDTRLAYQEEVVTAFEREDAPYAIEVVWPDRSTGTSTELFRDLADLIRAHEPQVVHMTAGLEDIRRHPEATRWYEPTVDLATYRSNLHAIVDLVRTWPKVGGVFASPIPIRTPDDSPWDAQACRDAITIAREVMPGRDMLLDRHDAVIDADPESLLESDGRTPNSEGRRRLAASVVRSVLGVVR